MHDPRINPRPGDTTSRNIKTALEGIILRDVTRAHGGFVFFRQDNGSVAKSKIVTLTEWRRWNKTAEICHTADEPDGSRKP